MANGPTTESRDALVGYGVKTYDTAIRSPATATREVRGGLRQPLLPRREPGRGEIPQAILPSDKRACGLRGDVVFGMNSSIWLPLAQAATEGAERAKDGAAVPPPGLGSMWPALLGIMALFYFLILRPQKAKDQQFRSLIDNLKETDRVVTIGGIYGVVTNVQREAGVVTLRVDDSTGAKIRVGTNAIARVVVDEEKSS